MKDMLTRARKGITPIIAIVLLLMMTVAAAGGAYAWLTQLQDQFQEDANAELNREITVIDLQCYNTDVDGSGIGTAGYVEVFFKNGGTAALDLSPIDMNVRSRATGNVNFSLTRSSFSLAYNDASPSRPEANRIHHPGGPEQDFSSPGDSSAYQIGVGEQETGSNFTVGDGYEIEFVFTDEDGTTKTNTCQAETR